MTGIVQQRASDMPGREDPLYRMSPMTQGRIPQW